MISREQISAVGRDRASMKVLTHLRELCSLDFGFHVNRFRQWAVTLAFTHICSVHLILIDFNISVVCTFKLGVGRNVVWIMLLDRPCRIIDGGLEHLVVRGFSIGFNTIALISALIVVGRDIAVQCREHVAGEVLAKQAFLHTTRLVDEISRLKVLPCHRILESAPGQVVQVGGIHVVVKHEARREGLAIPAAAPHDGDLGAGLGGDDVPVVLSGWQEDGLLWVALLDVRLVKVHLRLVQADDPVMTKVVSVSIPNPTNKHFEIHAIIYYIHYAAYEAGCSRNNIHA
jgi:hypothetical protein